MAFAGIVAGIAWSITVDPPWWLAAVFVTLGAAAGEAAVPVVRVITGETTEFDERLLTIVPVVAVSGRVDEPAVRTALQMVSADQEARVEGPPGMSERISTRVALRPLTGARRAHCCDGI